MTNLEEYWIYNLFMNNLAYATIVIPAYLLINHLKRINYKDNGNRNKFWYSYVVKCVYGDEPYELLPNTQTSQKDDKDKEEDSFTKKAIKLVCCTLGLQISYLTWGVLQERIMTQAYGSTLAADGSVVDAGEKFGNSQFLVFVNRVLALLVAYIYIRNSNQPNTTVPTYKYSFCSLSNVMSSWFQYEALKYVSFPTQVLGKACKVIPVMIMGKVVSGNKYSAFEWFTAALLSVGVSFFLFGTPKNTTSAGPDSTSFSGLILMCGYMGFDSFTSNWQGALFKEYKMSSFQMMLGVNLFSTTFTLVSLIQRGDFFMSIFFMLKYAEFMWHCIILSICSAVGQLFIYYTIGQFGAVVFIIIMTTRQALAILLSCIIYGHPVTAVGFLGILTVFLALGLRIHNTWSKKRQEAAQKAQN